MKSLLSLVSVLFSLSLISCNSKLSDPQIIIDEAIKAAGGEKYLDSNIEFDFRERHYVAKRKGGKYSYERIFDDSLGTIHDFLTNDGFRREINGQQVTVHDTMAAKYTSSTNSVNYFALLPYGLNDSAVIKRFVRETTINEKPYYVVRISFQPDGGGEDHEDVFLYWINQKSFRIDFLAYSFIESDETSFRFREAYNSRIINGILFQDYINYKPRDSSQNLDQAEELYKNGELNELSRIETENVTVD